MGLDISAFSQAVEVPKIRYFARDGEPLKDDLRARVEALPEYHTFAADGSLDGADLVLRSDVLKLVDAGLTEYDLHQRIIEAHLVASDMYRSLEGLTEGASYLVGKPAFHFHCGYFTWSRIREDLAQASWGVDCQAVWDDEGKFGDQLLYPLVNFTDCDGVLGPLACKRIVRGLELYGVRERFEKRWDSPRADVFERLLEIFRAGSTGLVLFA